MTIVVGYLPPREGRAALDAAIAEAEGRSQRLLIVLSDKSGPASVDGSSDGPEGLEAVRRELQDRGLPFDVQAMTQGRDVAEDLIAAAEDNGGTLIVIGLRRRSPVGKLILGSAASRILLSVSIPVLAVKADG